MPGPATAEILELIKREDEEDFFYPSSVDYFTLLVRSPRLTIQGSFLKADGSREYLDIPRAMVVQSTYYRRRWTLIEYCPEAYIIKFDLTSAQFKEIQKAFLEKDGLQDPSLKPVAIRFADKIQLNPMCLQVLIKWRRYLMRPDDYSYWSKEEATDNYLSVFELLRSDYYLKFGKVLLEKVGLPFSEIYRTYPLQLHKDLISHELYSL